MHVLFDARLLHRPLSGIERVQRNVLRELRKLPDIKRLQVVIQKDTRPPADLSNLEFAEVNDSEDILRLLKADQPDVYHLSWFPDRMPRDLWLPLAAKASVVEVHDAILNRHPEYYPQQDLWQWYQDFVKRLVAVADRILVHSKSVANEVVQDLGGNGELIDVANLAVDPSFATRPDPSEVKKRLAKLDLHGEYFLLLGKDYPHKDHATALRALAGLRELTGHGRIVCAGSKVWHRPGESSDELLEKLKLREHVRWITGLDDEDVKAVMLGSLALVYPSREEGFGLPPLEAMALGVPVLATTAMSIPEVCGDGAWLIEPGDHRALTKCMQDVRLGGPPVQELVARGRARQQQFSWRRCAVDTLQSYHNAVACAHGGKRRHRLDAGSAWVLESIARCPYSETAELRAWMARCHEAENHAKNVERNRGEILDELRELQARLGLPQTPLPKRAPRWSLKRRLKKIFRGIRGNPG